VRTFADTSYYIAITFPHDQWHRKALTAIHRGDELYTSSLVVNETVSLMQARGQLSTAIEFLRDARANPMVQVVHVDPVIQSEAWDLFARWGGIGANAVDCASFALMRRLGIKRALTFDRHFRAAGFQTLAD
jgi:predicted nucleic acid-binding protein